MADSPSLAEEVRALEEIVRRLEQEDVDLDAALKLFEEGIAGCAGRANSGGRGTDGPVGARRRVGRAPEHACRCLRRRRCRPTHCWPRRATPPTAGCTSGRAL